MSSISIEGVPSFVFRGSGYVPFGGHLTLIYKNGLGEEYVIRGSRTNYGGADEGLLTVLINVPIAESPDARVNPDGTIVTPEERGHIELDLGGRSAEDVWNTLIQQAENIKAHGYSYSELVYNSNGVVGNLLYLVGIDVNTVLPAIGSPHILPFWGKDVGFDFDYSLVGTGGDDILRGRGGSQIFYGGDGNDELSGGGGNDWLDGGAGIDTAVFGGQLRQYTVSHNADGSIAVSDRRWFFPDGADVLVGVEFARFSDVTLNLQTGEVIDNSVLQLLASVPEAGGGGAPLLSNAGPTAVSGAFFAGINAFFSGLFESFGSGPGSVEPPSSPFWNVG